MNEWGRAREKEKKKGVIWTFDTESITLESIKRRPEVQTMIFIHFIQTQSQADQKQPNYLQY